LPCGNRTSCRAVVGDSSHAQLVARLGAETFEQRQATAYPTLVPPQKLRHFHLAHAVFAHQGLNDPRFFQFPRTAAGAIEAVDGGFHRPLVGFHQPRREKIDLSQMARRAETFESIDQLIAFVTTTNDYGR
jgi:hypothetical protein